jgi:hypothetical protein
LFRNRCLECSQKHQEQFIEFSQTPAAPTRLTPKQAKAQWEIWSADPVGSGLIFKGSVEEKNLQFRIGKGTDVDFTSTLTLSKKLELIREKAKKNATLDDVTGATAKLMGGHSAIGGGAMDFRALAPNLLAGGGEALLGRDLQMPDITAIGLKNDVAFDEEEEEKDYEEEGQGDKDKDAKKSTWNKEKSIKDTINNLENVISKIGTEGRAMLADMERLNACLHDLEPRENEYIKQEKAIMHTKLKCLELVFKDEESLAQYLKTFGPLEPNSENPHQSEAASSVDDGAPVAHTMGSAPPCPLFADLKVFDTIEKQPERCLLCTTKEALDTVKKDVTSMIVPWRQLIGACKAAKVDLEKRRKHWNDKLVEEGTAIGKHSRFLDRVAQVLQYSTECRSFKATTKFAVASA